MAGEFSTNDLKTYLQNTKSRKTKLTIVKEINKDIGISHSVLKSVSKLLLKKGKLPKFANIKIDIDTAVQYLEQAGRYKYLGGE